MKIFAQISLVLVFLFVTAKFASASPITFGIDCMIHDNQGKMLSDLGAVGNVMGDYLATENFTYNGLHITADLNGPFAAAPEVATPQIQLTAFDANGKVLASLITTASENLNAALQIPNENLYLHCEKTSSMGM